MKRILLLLFTLLLIGCQPVAESASPSVDGIPVIKFPSNRYPETAQHIQEAIQAGETDVCTVDRARADDRREESLKGIPTKKGYDRDEFPMAVCLEGGKGANVKYISPKDNRGAGAWMGNQLEDVKDGQKVRIVVK